MGSILGIAPVVILQFATAGSAVNRLPDGTFARNVEESTGIDKLGPGTSGARVIRAQILLDRARFSPGQIDGVYGSALRIAITGYQERHGIQATGTIEPEMWKLLNADKKPVLTSYTITNEDVSGPFAKVPKELQEQATRSHLGYESVQEKLAEKFHLSPRLLADLNPGKKLDTPGEQIFVPYVVRPKARGVTRVTVSKSKRTVSAFDAQGKVIAQYPATIGGPHDPLPIGNWKVTVIQRNPWFYYNPELFWNAKPDEAKAKLPPGPNNPSGVVWIGLSKEHYGIHGTPEPEQIRHEESFGCVRLTNWDALDLSAMIRRGTPVLLEE